MKSGVFFSLTSLSLARYQSTYINECYIKTTTSEEKKGGGGGRGVLTWVFDKSWLRPCTQYFAHFATFALSVCCKTQIKYF